MAATAFDPPPPGTFDLGLCLAGAVSAGAYIAGVLDFLIEALDAWEAAKDTEKDLPSDRRTVPSHRVRLRCVTGASGGAMTAAIAAVALHYRFPHLRLADVDERNPQGRGNGDRNPFFQPWVNDIDISDLLGQADLAKDKTLGSVLDSSKLPAIVARALSFTGPLAKRTYVHEPLAVRLTVGNLCGVPYQIGMKGLGEAHPMVMHRDYVGFSVFNEIASQSLPQDADEHALPFPNSPTDMRWHALGHAALASGSFPIFLRARGLSRLRDLYFKARPFVVPGDGTPGSAHRDTKLVPVKPAFPPDADPEYRYLCVDGGVMNNEPIELARAALAGPLGRNPRDGKLASRAVVLVDPFIESSPAGPEIEETPLLKQILPLFDAWKMECRFKTVDLALAEDETVYSRFLIAPSRGDDRPVAKHPLCAGGLGGFLGFFHRAFRMHDFLLGRRNCQQFLKVHFSLPETNTLFGGWSQAARNAWRIGGGEDAHLPVIPCLGACAADEALPPWPAGRLDPESLRDPIKRRADAVYGAMKDALNLGTGARLYLNPAWSLYGRGALVDKAVGAVRSALAGQKLD